MYHTFDNKLYKNGKRINFDTPETDPKISIANNYESNNIGNLSKNYQTVSKEGKYHQKGIRHH